MRHINMQKTVQNASNSYAKNSAKYEVNFFIEIWRIFQCFLQENWQKIAWQFCIFFKLFRDDFLLNCVQGWEKRDPGQIPVNMRQSRSGLH